MIRRIPWTTFAVIAGALLIAASPALREKLIYDRDKILAGELWRTFTGHWVHLSLQHLLIDASAFSIAGVIVEAKHRSRFAAMCACGPWLIGAATLLISPHMQQYCGLSALALSVFAFLGVSSLREQGFQRVLGIAILVLASAKIGFELFAQSALFVHSQLPGVRVAVASHAVGAFVGGLFALPSSRLILPCVSFGARAKQVRSESPDYSRQV